MSTNTLRGSVGVVLDVGSQDTKAGFAGESFPRCVVPTSVGRFRHAGLIDGFPEVSFGKEAKRNRGLLNMRYPVKDGLIDSWDEIEMFWHHVFYKGLHVPPEDTQVLYSIHPLTPRKQKERIAEILFETFMIHDLYLAISSALCLHASGRTSGVVWENGFSSCYASSVFEGFPLKHTVVCSDLNGRALTEFLGNLLKPKGYSFTTPADIEILNKIKAELCSVAKDYNKEIAAAKDRQRFELPDGQYVLIGEERFTCPEVLFQPSIQENICPSIVDDICCTINKSDLDYQALLFNNIVISGGSSMFYGLPERLGIELSKRVIDLPGIEAKVDAMPSRSVSAWAGGSILASLSTMNEFWVSREEYGDVGTNCVNYKFY